MHYCVNNFNVTAGYDKAYVYDDLIVLNLIIRF